MRLDVVLPLGLVNRPSVLHVAGFAVTLPLASLPSANESGETPLDIARRLRHEHCEELVSVWPARAARTASGVGEGPHPLGEGCS